MQFINRNLVILCGLMGISLGAIAACSANSPTSGNMMNNSNNANRSPGMMGTPGTMGSPGMMNHSMTMDLGPADANYDLRFIDGMILHHEGAVVMAEEAQRKSTRSEIKKLAADIIKAQREEIAKMKVWRTAWYSSTSPTPQGYSSSAGHIMPMSQEQMNSMMMSGNLGEADNQFDLRFIKAMIPHHEGALVMAKDALGKSQRPEIKQLAEAILSSQTGEINQMKQWRKDWYNQ